MQLLRHSYFIYLRAELVDATKSPLRTRSAIRVSRRSKTVNAGSPALREKLRARLVPRSEINSLSAPASPLKAWRHKVVTKWSIWLILLSRRVASWVPTNGALWSHGLTACVNTAGVSFSVQRRKPSSGSEVMPPNGSQLRITISPRAEYKRSLPPYVRHQAQRRPGASVHSDL
jgi:hypothetical protein